MMCLICFKIVLKRKIVQKINFAIALLFAMRYNYYIVEN